MIQISNQKPNIEKLMSSKRYKLSLLGNSPRSDWTAAILFGFALMLIFSALYYFDSLKFKRTVFENEQNLVVPNYFDIEKAKATLHKLSN